MRRRPVVLLAALAAAAAFIAYRRHREHAVISDEDLDGLLDEAFGTAQPPTEEERRRQQEGLEKILADAPRATD